MTAALPTLFTQRPSALLLDQWATRDGLPHRVARFNPLDATCASWHMPRVAVIDIADLDLLADRFGDRRKDGSYTIAVGTGDQEQTQLREAVALDRVDLAARVDLLPHRYALTAALDKAQLSTPDQLRAAVADAAHSNPPSRFHVGRRHARQQR